MKRPTTRRSRATAAAGPRPSPAPGGSVDRPSWINRFADWLDRRRGPAWAYYAIAAAGIAAVQLAVQTAAGRPVSGFNLVVAVVIPYLIGLMHYLIRTAGQAFDEFRSALRASDPEAADLRRRFTTLPARPVLLAGTIVSLASIAALVGTFTVPSLSSALSGGLGLVRSPADIARVFQAAATPASLGLTLAIMFASWWATATYGYLTLHQLRTIRRIYAHHTDIRLFRLGPLYAFSRHTMRSALGLLLLAYALLASAPDVMGSALGFGSWLLLIGGAVATFLLPLVGIHGHLAREKDRLLQENGRRFEVAVADVHRLLDSGRLGPMSDLNRALANLEIERAALERVPTWPWEPGTLRGLIGAVLIPVIIWIIQALLAPALDG